MKHDSLANAMRDLSTCAAAWDSLTRPDVMVELIAEGVPRGSELHRRLVVFACACGDYATSWAGSWTDFQAEELQGVLLTSRRWATADATQAEVLDAAEVARDAEELISSASDESGQPGLTYRAGQYACRAVESAARVVEDPRHANSAVQCVFGGVSMMEQAGWTADFVQLVKEHFSLADVLYCQRAWLRMGREERPNPLLDAATAEPDDVERWLVLGDWFEEREDPRAEWMREIAARLSG